MIAPGLFVTVGDCAPVQRDLAAALAILAQVRPDGVILHTYPGPEDRAAVEMIRREHPSIRVWVQPPANELAGLSEARAVDRVRGWVRAAVDLGAELLSFNGEGASRAGASGWKPNQPLGVLQVARRAEVVLDAARDEAAGRLALAWSSHDRVGSHALPWRAIYGDGSPVTVALPQVYADPGDGSRASIAGARARLEGTARQWAAMVSARAIRADVAPGGAGWCLYAQSHHHATEALAWLLDQSALAATWTIRADGALCDAAGVLALRVDAELRRRVGHAPGRIARWQRQTGLTPDGIAGAATRASLGVT